MGLWILLWAEHVVDEFYAIGLPLQVGGLTIKKWSTFWVFISGLSILTILRAYIKHTIERRIDSERAHLQEPIMTTDRMFWWVLWDVYEKIVDTSTILIAVLRIDIWFLLFTVHIMTVTYLLARKLNPGRRPRT